MKNTRGKDVAQRLSYPVQQLEDGSSGQFGGAGRYTAMTQDVGEQIVTTFGCHDIMYLRTVSVEEAATAAATKHASSIEAETYGTDAAVDAFRNYVSTIDVIFHLQGDIRGRLEALPDELVRYIRANESMEPGLHTRQYVRRYCNALLRRLTCLMPCLTVTEEDIVQLLKDMTVTMNSPFHRQAVAGMQAELESDLTQIKRMTLNGAQSKKETTTKTTKPASTDLVVKNKAKGKKRERKTPSTSNTKGPCFMIYTTSGCDKGSDCVFDHDGKDLTGQDKAKLKVFMATRNKDKPEAEQLKLRSDVL